MDDNERVPRPVRLADFTVIIVGFIHNLTQIVELAASELLEIAVYNANRKTKVSRVWEEFRSDLEKLPEETDGTSGFN